MTLRKRHKLMDDFDDALLSFALKDAFPGVVFQDREAQSDTERFVRRSSIPECRSSIVHIRFVPEGWEPDFVFPPGFGFPWNMMNPPKYTLDYCRNDWFWGVPQTDNWIFSLPTMEVSSMDIDYDRSSDDDRVLVTKLWRVLNRLMTNRLKSALRSEWRTMAEAKGGVMWAGHHALQWCREGERRMLGGSLIPCDDWALPDNDWYQDLYRRVVDKYGPNFGDPTWDTNS